MAGNARVSAYECSYSPKAVSETGEIKAEDVSKGRYLWGRYGAFTWHDLQHTIIPEIREKRIAGWPFDMPILIATHQLLGGRGRSSGPLVMVVPSAFRARRRKDPRTEAWEAIIDKDWQMIKVVGKDPWEV